MAKHTFGEPVSEDDILEIQGIEYPMQPIGMRAMRRVLSLRKQVIQNKDKLAEGEVSEQQLDWALEAVIGTVRPEHHEALRNHIEDSVPPHLLVKIATAVLRSFSDLDPTQQESSPNGSTPTGPDSAAGAPLAPPTPTT